MGFWDELTKPLPINIWNLNSVRKQLKGDLEKASEYLGYAEHFVDDGHKLIEYRGKVNEVVKVLSMPDTAVKNLMSAVKITQAVYDLRGNIRDDPQKAAKAFGKLFSGIGELASYLPFPINSYLAIFAEAENFFENIRVQMQPDIHFKEPGISKYMDDPFADM